MFYFHYKKDNTQLTTRFFGTEEKRNIIGGY